MYEGHPLNCKLQTNYKHASLAASVSLKTRSKIVERDTNLFSLRSSRVFLLCPAVDRINSVIIRHIHCYYRLSCIATQGATDEKKHSYTLGTRQMK